MSALRVNDADLQHFVGSVKPRRLRVQDHILLWRLQYRFRTTDGFLLVLGMQAVRGVVSDA